MHERSRGTRRFLAVVALLGGCTLAREVARAAAARARPRARFRRVALAPGNRIEGVAEGDRARDAAQPPRVPRTSASASAGRSTMPVKSRRNEPVSMAKAPRAA